MSVVTKGNQSVRSDGRNGIDTSIEFIPYYHVHSYWLCHQAATRYAAIFEKPL